MIAISNSSTLAVTASTNLPGNAINVIPGSLLDTTAAAGFSLTSGNLLTIGRPGGLRVPTSTAISHTARRRHVGASAARGSAATLTEAGNLCASPAGSWEVQILVPSAQAIWPDVTNLNLGAAVIDINMPAGSLSNGSYDLINYSGSLSGSASTLMLSGAASGTVRQSFTLVTSASSAGSLLLQVAGSPASLVWTGSQNGTWDTSSLNWSKQRARPSSNSTTTTQ